MNIKLKWLSEHPDKIVEIISDYWPRDLPFDTWLIHSPIITDIVKDRRHGNPPNLTNNTHKYAVEFWLRQVLSGEMLHSYLWRWWAMRNCRHIVRLRDCLGPNHYSRLLNVYYQEWLLSLLRKVE